VLPGDAKQLRNLARSHKRRKAEGTETIRSRRRQRQVGVGDGWDGEADFFTLRTVSSISSCQPVGSLVHRGPPCRFVGGTRFHLMQLPEGIDARVCDTQ